MQMPEGWKRLSDLSGYYDQELTYLIAEALFHSSEMANELNLIIAVGKEVNLKYPKAEMILKRFREWKP